MTMKISTWLMACGCFIAFVGLCFIPAAFGPDPERTMLGAGTVIVATGVLLLALSVYLKASVLGPQAGNPASGAKRARKTVCDQCGEDEPVIQCRVHQVHLCGDCLAGHYDFRSCAYVPSTRRGSAKSAAAAYSQAASS
jgi:hypothetical protein